MIALSRIGIENIYKLLSLAIVEYEWTTQMPTQGGGTLWCTRGTSFYPEEIACIILYDGFNSVQSTSNTTITSDCTNEVHAIDL